MAGHACILRLYMCRYWHGRGLTAIFINGLLNVLALGFTVAFSAFLLLFVNWEALHADCIVQVIQPLIGRSRSHSRCMLVNLKGAAC